MSNILKPKKLPRPVISIGNLSVGGTGKTPLTIYTAKKLIQTGFNVCVLSRGYKRKSDETLIVSDGNDIYVDWSYSGDEPYLIAKNGIPVVVSKSRYEGGIKALEFMEVDIFILDDGFQHFQLYRDIDIVTVDATKPFWNDRLLPEGRLREPRMFYKYADVIVVNKLFSLKKQEIKKVVDRLKKLDKPFFLSSESVETVTDGYTEYPIEFLKGKKVGVFSGLANNQQFFNTVKDLSERFNFQVIEFVSFPDHYNYTDLKFNKTPDLWLTTEKDLIKIKENTNIFALKYTLDLDPEYLNILIERLK